MVTRPPEALAHDGMTPLERELALASFGPDAHNAALDTAPTTPHGTAAAADTSDAAPRARTTRISHTGAPI